MLGTENSGVILSKNEFPEDRSSSERLVLFKILVTVLLDAFLDILSLVVGNALLNNKVVF
jgi:hypothetical protein